MIKTKKLVTMLLALTLVFASVPSAFAAEGSAKIGLSGGEPGNINVNFSTGYSVSQKNSNPGGDIPIMENIYHVDPDCVLTISNGGTETKWSAYASCTDESFDSHVDLKAGQTVTAKYFSDAAAGKNFWNTGAKDTLVIIDKTGMMITIAGNEGPIGEFYVNFDGKGTATAPVTTPKNPTTPATTTQPTTTTTEQPGSESPAQPVTAPSGMLKTTGGLYGTLPPLPTPGQDLSYTVMPKETLAGIGFNYYGSMSANTINKIKRANDAYFKKTRGVLEAYAVIRLPKEGLINPVLPASLNNAAGAYLVNRGDTLADISKVYYGNTNSWRKIYEANKSRVKLVGNSPMIYEKQWLLITK